MRHSLIVLSLVLGAAEARADSWVSEDKALHFGFSGAIAIGGYGAATSFSESLPARVGFAASVSLLSGIGKELWDASGGNGDPSWKDLTWDVLGAAVGVAICWAIDRFVVPIFARVP